jgi:hypothetical protein
MQNLASRPEIYPERNRLTSHGRRGSSEPGADRVPKGVLFSAKSPISFLNPSVTASVRSRLPAIRLSVRQNLERLQRGSALMAISCARRQLGRGNRSGNDL